MDIFLKRAYKDVSTTTIWESHSFGFAFEKLWMATFIVEFVVVTGFIRDVFGYELPRYFHYQIIPAVLANSIMSILLLFYLCYVLRRVTRDHARQLLSVLHDVKNTPVKDNLLVELVFNDSLPSPRANGSLPPVISSCIRKLIRDRRVKIRSMTKEKNDCCATETESDENMQQNLKERKEARRKICYKLENSQDSNEQIFSQGITLVLCSLYVISSVVFICFYLDLPKYRTTICAITVVLGFVSYFVLIILVCIFKIWCCPFVFLIRKKKMLEDAKNILVRWCSPRKDAQSPLGSKSNSSIKSVFAYHLHIPDYVYYPDGAGKTQCVEVFRMEVSTIYSCLELCKAEETRELVNIS